LLINSGEVHPAYFVIEIGGLAKQFDGLYPTLGSWTPLRPSRASLFASFPRLVWLAHRITAQHKAPQAAMKIKTEDFFS